MNAIRPGTRTTLLTALLATMSLLAVASPVLAAAPAAGGSANTEQLSLFERLWHAQGHTHPIVVHFPIGVLFAGALAAVIRTFSRKIPLSIIYFCLMVGTGGAILSTLAGWAWAPQLKPGWDPYDKESPFFWHRWGGVVITVISMLVFGWATLMYRRYHRRIVEQPIERPAGLNWKLEVWGSLVVFGSLLVPTALYGLWILDPVTFTPTRCYIIGGALVALAVFAFVMRERAMNRAAAPDRGQFGWQYAIVLLSVGMGWVGHEGGELVYEENAQKIIRIASGDRPVKFMKMEVAKKDGDTTTPVIAKVTPTATQPAGTQPAGGTAVSGSIDFAKQLWPVFEAKCNYCHGADEDKGGYRMHTREQLIKGGESETASVIPGNAKDSPFYKHITGEDTDNFSLMPPKKEKKPMTPEEIELVKKWIDEGAPWNK